MTRKRLCLFVGAVLLAILVSVEVFRRNTGSGAEVGDVTRTTAHHCLSEVVTVDAKCTESRSEAKADDAEGGADGSERIEEASSDTMTAEDAFDAEVDRWMDPQPSGVTMKDVETFHAAFDRVPSDAREACLQRALNLIPDENALLIAGILLDKAQSRETLETVFNDVLNRDEQVKRPLLKSIYKDSTHPCWADAAWILDVTGDAAHDTIAGERK